MNAILKSGSQVTEFELSRWLYREGKKGAGKWLGPAQGDPGVALGREPRPLNLQPRAPNPSSPSAATHLEGGGGYSQACTYPLLAGAPAEKGV